MWKAPFPGQVVLNSVRDEKGYIFFFSAFDWIFDTFKFLPDFLSNEL